MARFRHGFVLGKFYPPHAGHHLLVRQAARQCERLTVGVFAATVESIPLGTRVAWMREVHAAETNVTVTGAIDDTPVDVGDPAIWDAHMAVFRGAIARVTAEPVDAVFTSESYGDELGRRFGAAHVAVDPSRGREPVSGTAVRRDPAAHWRFIEAPVRRWFAKRVVIVGAESTGKSTLAAELADARGTAWVAEYGREHAEEKLGSLRVSRPAAVMEDVAWDDSDFETIAAEQQRREERAAGESGPVLIADTDAFATAVWCERYLGRQSLEVETIAARSRPALYLLTHHDDVPFVQDGTRDGERVRAWMTQRFAERLDATARRWQWIRGTRDERRAAALVAIDALLAEGWALAPPLG